MKCEQLLALLNDYIDGDIQPTICTELEQHLASCNPCQIVVDTIKKTITLYKAGQPYELPPHFRERLHAELRARWKQSKEQKPQIEAREQSL
ncbi:MAG: anti-sigma factor [Verrucomicrobiae bacterium]|nr:anti-sigma factor [Verrucomicrobiae bacterium]